ncbi:hypothetical protein GYMLUDRAFT_37504 [Collybiopsis luxurians FD-317 M1]|nr:hypothetical protein GYMLUDRAFT_37504 [Collybiopsis luxurians FD-317 M1]
MDTTANVPAGLSPLVPLLYHETQQPGSMLCAANSLNNLLQGNYFSAVDLSEIARDLDDLERSYAGNQSEGSHNMDDTGFFSVQVLENALAVWGLSLLRWRGEQMLPYQDHPEEERAFILNQQQHWYTLRRFGASESSEGGTISGHWFNLNSYLPGPEWVSKLYLQMFLQQAEADGYSVFVVRPTDPEAPLSLPKTEADEIASTLSEGSGTRTHGPRPGGVSMEFEGLEDEDVELQMALQASLGRDIPSPPAEPPRLVRTSIPLPSTASFPPSGSGSGALTPSQPADSSLSPLDSPIQEHDSIAGSMAQSRRIYERMLAEQAQAHREIEAGGGGSSARRRQEEEEEEEMLRRAIAESEAMARIEGHGRPDDEDEEDDMDIDSRQSARVSQGFAQSRVYDDEDQELQAALRASLEQMPADWNPPSDAPAPAPPSNTAHPDPLESRADDDESLASEDTAPLEPDEPETPAEPVNLEDMRRRRLARFGG